MPAQPPGGVRADRFGGAVGEQHPHRCCQGVAQGRAGEHGQHLGPGVVVDQVEVADRHQFGHHRRYGGIRQRVEDVLAPDVHRVQQSDVVGLGEVPVPRIHFVRVEDDIGGPDEREVGHHAHRRQRLLAPALGQLSFAGREFTLPDDPLEGAARVHQLTRGRQLTVLVGQRERPEPGLVPRCEVGVPDQPEHCLGQFLGAQRSSRPAVDLVGEDVVGVLVRVQ